MLGKNRGRNNRPAGRSVPCSMLVALNPISFLFLPLAQPARDKSATGACRHEGSDRSKRDPSLISRSLPRRANAENCGLDGGGQPSRYAPPGLAGGRERARLGARWERHRTNEKGKIWRANEAASDPDPGR